MGQAKSSNYASILMSANTDLSTSITQDASAGGNANTFISQVCKGGGGTCKMKDINVSETGSSATSAMQDAVSKSTSVQKMNEKL